LYRATGLLAPIAGGAPSFGYNEVADIPLKTLDGEDINELFNEFQQVLRIFNSQRTPLIERLTFPVAEPFERVAQVSAADFEEADEFGQPKGIRTPVPYWNMGYDLKYMDLGLRYTFRFLGRADSRQLRANNAAALDADNRLIYKTVFDRAFNNLLTVATMEDTGTAVNCYPFYNGTVQTLPAAPPQWKSFTFTTSHDHYLVSANTAVTSANLDAMWETLYHHGYTEGGTCLLAINLQEIKRIRAFRVASGDSYDWIPARDAYDSTFRGTLVGDLATAPAAAGGIDNFPGFQGVYGPWNVIQEDMIPAGYLFGFVSGGVRAERNPIGFREHENAALRGLKLIPQFERYPLRESFYHHAVGSGIRHRGAGIIMQVKASGSYDIPSVIYGGPGGR
jgi:hypothetical protein